jgi:hypothetical protein
VEFGVKVAEVPMPCDDFFKMRLHTGKVRLIEKDATATAVCCSFGTFEVFAFPIEGFSIVSEPKQHALFKDDCIPLNHPGMVRWSPGK